MKNNKTVLSVVCAIVLVITLITTTYAFFRPQGDILKSRDVSASSNTTDYLSFQISNDISFRVTQADFAQGNGNKYGETTATAVLTPNNKTGEGTANYYMYLNLMNNGIIYSSTNTNYYPELLLQVFDSNDDLVEIDYFNDTVTYGSLEGYDITGVTGLIPLLNNHEISASNNTSTTETWRIVITMINLDVDQQDNTNKEINASISIQKNVMISPTVRIAYNANGGVGSMSSETIDNISGEIINKNTFTRDGYYFYGWNTKADGTGDTYVDLAKLKNVTGTDNLTLYAIWKNGPGLYNPNTRVFTPWDELEIDLDDGELLTTNDDLIGILILPNTVTSIDDWAIDYVDLYSIYIPSSVTYFGQAGITECDKLESIIVDPDNPVYDSRNNSNAVIETATNKLIVGCTNTVIPNGVTRVDDFAFFYAGLEELSIPNTVISIGECAFEGNYIENLVIPSSVQHIEDFAFSDNRIKNIYVPSSLTSIESGAFSQNPLETITVDSNNPVYDCRNNSNAIIETATNTLIIGSTNTIIPNTVTSIGEYAFSGSDISSITIPSSVTSIEKAAFKYSKITSVNIPGSVTSIGDEAFFACSDLSTAVLESGVQSIGFRAFTDSGLTSINFPNTVTTLGEESFSHSKLRNITIPGSITTIPKSAFSSTQDLTTVVIENGVQTIGKSAFSYSNVSNINIPNSVTTIGYGAFDFTKIKNIEIPSSVTSIERLSFYGCKELESITVDSNNPVYDSRNNCNAVIETATNKLIVGTSNTVIPNDVTIIGEYAFYGSGITGITIPSSVTSIGKLAFASCKELESIVVDSNNPVYDSRDNCNAIIETSTNKLITGCNSTIIPNTVKSIGESAFDGSGITSVTIPYGVTIIEGFAFSGAKITSITIPSSVTSIGYVALSSNSLKTIFIPNSVTSINDWAFRYIGENSIIYAQSNELAARLEGKYDTNRTTLIVDPSKF